jgi:hypothetical protein
VPKSWLELEVLESEQCKCMFWKEDPIALQTMSLYTVLFLDSSNLSNVLNSSCYTG